LTRLNGVFKSPKLVHDVRHALVRGPTSMPIRVRVSSAMKAPNPAVTPGRYAASDRLEGLARRQPVVSPSPAASSGGFFFSLLRKPPSGVVRVWARPTGFGDHVPSTGGRFTAFPPPLDRLIPMAFHSRATGVGLPGTNRRQVPDLNSTALACREFLPAHYRLASSARGGGDLTFGTHGPCGPVLGTRIVDHWYPRRCPAPAPRF